MRLVPLTLGVSLAAVAVLSAPSLAQVGGTGTLQHSAVRVQDVVPNDVEIRPFDEVLHPRMKGHSYFLSPDDKIVVVHTATRRVAEIVSRSVLQQPSSRRRLLVIDGRTANGM